jgi:hypothetical protein
MTIQQQFAEGVKAIISQNDSVVGLAVGGSWLANEVDEWSDLDLILVTGEKIGGDTEKMLAYAEGFGHLLNGFTGEHVGEPRLLVCLYDHPLLHVDIKFLTLEEFAVGRVEKPVILHDTDGQLQQVLDATTHQFPHPDYQWMEDRFWIWVHYALMKIGRGEHFEALDFFAYLRMVVLGPLLHIKNGNLPRGVRKVEMSLPAADVAALNRTAPTLDRSQLLAALQSSVELYRSLRGALFTEAVLLHTKTEERVMAYFETFK